MYRLACAGFILVWSHFCLAATCEVSPEKLLEYLKMDFQNFDQTLHKGMRELEDLGCDYQAAQVIDIWHLHNQGNLTSGQERVSYFHAGQSYAFVGPNLYSVAAQRFSESIDPAEPPDNTFKWNAYVRGSIAFLERNLSDLKKYRDELACATTGSGRNLAVLDRMISCFDRSYKDAYSSSQQCSHP